MPGHFALTYNCNTILKLKVCKSSPMEKLEEVKMYSCPLKRKQIKQNYDLNTIKQEKTKKKPTKVTSWFGHCL